MIMIHTYNVNFDVEVQCNLRLKFIFIIGIKNMIKNDFFF